MKKIGMYALTLMMGVWTGCSNEEVIQNPVENMEDFVAVVSEGESRTSLGAGGMKVNWTTGENADALAIFRKSGKGYNTKYTLKSVTDAGVATFTYSGEYSPTESTPNVTLSHTYAVYPYSGDFTMEQDGKANVTIPATQTYTTVTTGEGESATTTPSFDPAAAFMVAVSDNQTLVFNNAQALLKVVLTKMPGDEDYTIESINLASATSGLSGTATISMTTAANPAVAFTSTSGNITLDCGSGVVVNSLNETNAAVFYLVVTPGTYSDLTMTLTYDNNETKALTLPTLTIARNKVYTIKHTCGSDDFTGTIPNVESSDEDANQ